MKEKNETTEATANSRRFKREARHLIWQISLKRTGQIFQRVNSDEFVKSPETPLGGHSGGSVSRKRSGGGKNLSRGLRGGKVSVSLFP